MRIPVEWVAEVCDEATKILKQDRHQIRGDAIGGKYWAAHCYEQAVEIVRERHSRT